MPTRKKKLVEDEQENQLEETPQEELETKPKKRAVRKKKVVSTDEVVPPRAINSIEEVEEITLVEVEEEIPVEAENEVPAQPVHARSVHERRVEHRPVDPTHFHPRRDGMSKAVPVEELTAVSDIKPRPHTVHPDASFLAPEKFGFELREKHLKRKHHTKWLKGFFYFLGTLIILTAVGLFLLSAYSTRLLNNESENAPAVTNEEQNPAAPSSGQYSIVNAEKEISEKLNGLISEKFDTELTYNADALPTLPQVETDTLFYRSQAQDQVNSLQAFLSDLGIKPELQINDQMSSDIALYLVNIIPQPDLSGLTSVVYNATSTTGLAKSNCDLLNSWKVAGCQALNATTEQTGSAITYKSDRAYFTLKRTEQFRAVKFSQADSNQVEDIRVTLGR